MKLDKKQVPLFVGLCVVTLVMLGYAAFTMLGGGSERSATASTTTVTAANPELAAPPAAKAPLPTLTPTFRPDPFKPTLTDGAVSPGAVASQPKPAVPVSVAVRETMPDFPPPSLEPAPWVAPVAPAVVPKTAKVMTPAATVPAVALPPQVKPSFTLTGILEGDTRVAILRLSDTQRQVVQEKDRVAEQYVVDEITPNAVVLVSGTERWRLFLDN